MKKIYFLLLIVVMLVCFGIFFFQLENNVDTIIIFNATEIPENGTAVGFLMDSLGNGIPNKTITFHKPGSELGTIVCVTTDENGMFVIENLEYHPEYGDENYYGDFTFAGDDKYKGTTYANNLTVIHK